MIKTILILMLLFFLSEAKPVDCNTSFFKSIEKCDADWVVIGAGPAGISTVGVLLSLGVLQDRITWLDPEFNVGRLSTFPTVVANNKSKFFIKFIESCKTFTECVPKAIEKLKELDPEKEYPLSNIIDPLQEITSCILKKVKSFKFNLQSLHFENDSWQVGVNNQTLTAYNVVLATGSHPKTLNYEEHKSKEIPLDKALDKSYLEKLLTPEDVVAVVGASHSGILILKYLSELSIKKIINFYHKPILYPIDMGTWTLNDENGIKGVAAEWAKNVLEKNPPANLIRLKSSPEIIKEVFPTCTRIVYSIGFERNDLPNVNGNSDLNYDAKTGVIATRLFGIGIAFPEQHVNPIGDVEYKIGLNSFIEYAQRIIPCWMQKRGLKYKEDNQKQMLQMFEELFRIEIL